MDTQITGRDNYIIAKALAYAVLTIDNLPRARQERSDRNDMLSLLIARVGPSGQLVSVLMNAEAHVGAELSSDAETVDELHANLVAAGKVPASL